MSHPVWVRGLKRFKHPHKTASIPSHPVWVRGLKLVPASEWNAKAVAPRVGAWIETILSTVILILLFVAPRVGAWIETLYAQNVLFTRGSHPVWVRGLKPRLLTT